MENKLNNGEVIESQNGQKTIKCWHCGSTMKALEEWDLVECPTCEKVCKIPEIKKESNIKYLNNNLNLSGGVTMPFVHAIVICPFCRTDNKVRTQAETMICYVCKNNVNISKPNEAIPKTQTKLANKSPNRNMYKKEMRFSDLFYPDPMFFPGYYPMQGTFSYLYPNYDPFYEDYKKKKKLFEDYKEKILKERLPIRERLSHIRSSLELKDGVDETKSTGYEERIRNLKEKLRSNKKDKNHAIYMNILERTREIK